MSREQACEQLKKFNFLDPLRVDSPDSLANILQAGFPFALDLPTGRLVYVLDWRGNMMWIAAAAGDTTGCTLQALTAIERQAQQNAAEAVGFMTARRGLVKLAESAGYEITGWVLRKAVHEPD